jgi:hypothetical protein
MPTGPGLFPDVPPSIKNMDDAELEWLLCLASAFQACQRTLNKDGIWVRRVVLRSLGAKSLVWPKHRLSA